jgi:hypothetical protein
MACTAQGSSGAGTFCDDAMGVSDVGFLGEVFSTVCPLTLLGCLGLAGPAH